MTQGLADLHIHSTASDGSLTPAEIVKAARARGLAAIAIADHDTITGLEEAVAAGRDLGVSVIPAVEINTNEEGREAHILGYFIDAESGPLLSKLGELRESRLRRAEEMVARLADIGIRVTLERVLEIADGAPVARPHVARAIVEAGRARTLACAFGRFLVPGAPAYVTRHKFSALEAIELVRKAGGVAGLAHPGKDLLQDLIPGMIEAGLQAIEVYHVDHSAAISRRYAAIADRCGLIATGGSDSHGPGGVKPVEIGQVAVSDEVVERLREAAGGRR